MWYRLTRIFIILISSYLLFGCAGTPVGGSKSVSVVNQAKNQEILARKKAAKAVAARRQALLLKKYRVASALMVKGKDDQAMQRMQTLTTEDPSLSGPWVSMGMLAEKKQDETAAKKFYETALKYKPGSIEALNNLGLIYQSEGHFKKAQALFQKGLRINPGNMTVNYNLAVLNELYLNNMPKALHYYQSYLASLDKPDPKVSMWIKLLKRKIGHR